MPQNGKARNPYRDFQRKKVYDWEDKVIKSLECSGDSIPISLERCQDIVNTVWQNRGLMNPPPRVTDGRGRRRASGSRYRVKLPVWSRRRWMVLHEVAHSIDHYLQHRDLHRNQPRGGWHGPKFMKIYLHLLADHCGESFYELLESAQDHKIEVAS